MIVCVCEDEFLLCSIFVFGKVLLTLVGACVCVCLRYLQSKKNELDLHPKQRIRSESFRANVWKASFIV